MPIALKRPKIPDQIYHVFTITKHLVASLLETTSTSALFEPAGMNKLFPALSVNPFVVANLPSM
jgi:hypothetical protein